jgi:hypothetical protein
VSLVAGDGERENFHRSARVPPANTWNENAKPFEWVATADEILGKVRIIERDFRKMLACNGKQHYITRY